MVRREEAVGDDEKIEESWISNLLSSLSWDTRGGAPLVLERSRRRQRHPNCNEIAHDR